ncbi:helix-turn-helix transcriptional regulator [Vallitalea okinawensis]|uniref:helix-turn-helix transcriptional regulator n=1 Tax=Vallitalea okinawensis TaxID=2078660 RepID=UPI000CFD9B99|nr:AraC family transcriptional regulator [Vallitalea okinawensis]
MQCIEDIHHKYIDYHIYNLNDQYDNKAGHSHHRFEISLILQGEGTYQINGKMYEIQAGDIYIIGNDIQHGLHVKEGCSVKNMVFHFEPRFIWAGGLDQMNRNYLRTFIGQSKSFNHRLSPELPITKMLTNLLVQCSSEFERHQLDYDLLIKSTFMTILVWINRHYAESFEVDSKRQSRVDYYRMNEVISYIHQHFMDAIRLDDLAALAHLEPSYFSKVFKEINGISPVSYINYVRIDKAIRMLRDYHCTLEQVSWKCGFKSYSNFVKIFKKIRNETPSTYRRTWHREG